MQLLILLLVVGIVGYILAKSQYGKQIDATTEKLVIRSEGLIDKARGWWRDRYGKRKQKNAFIAWATGPGADYFPEDLRTWWLVLAPNEAEQFTRALSSYAEGLGFHLDELVNGKMESKPALLQVFMEAIVVFSNEYQRARQAQAEAIKAGDATPSDGNLVAEKQASRRKDSSGDSTQASTVA